MGGALKKRFKLRDRRSLYGASRLNSVQPRGFQESGWKASYARCVGTSHLEAGSPCQDQVDAKTYPNGVTVIALSDGAGSAAYSHYGAYIAVQRSMDLVAEHFAEAFGDEQNEQDFKHRLIALLQQDLNEAATVGINLTEEERVSNNEPSRTDALLIPCAVRKLACTLLMVAIKGNFYLAIHLGDGVIGAQIVDGRRDKLIVVSRPSNGEFANETVFLTSSTAEDAAFVVTGRLNKRQQHIVGFILMSDGPEMALYQKATESLAPSCTKLFNANRRLDSETMQEQLYATIKNVIQRKTGDDCSIAIATIKEG